MRRARLIALPLALLAGALIVVGLVACGEEKKDRRKTRTKTVTVQEGATPTSPTGALSPKDAKKAAAAGGLPPGADSAAAGGLPSGAGAPPSGGIPAGAIPSGGIPSGGIPAGALPPGGIPPGAIPSGGSASGFSIPDRVKVKVDSSRRVSRNLEVCRQNREICNAVDNVRDVFR